MANIATVLAHVDIARRALDHFDHRNLLLLDDAGDRIDRGTAERALKTALDECARALAACARALADLQALP